MKEKEKRWLNHSGRQKDEKDKQEKKSEDWNVTEEGQMVGHDDEQGKRDGARSLVNVFN